MAELFPGDCLAVMRGLGDATVDLAYLDPPFCTGRVMRGVMRVPQGGAGGGASRFAFDDRWEDLGRYLDFLRERLLEVRRLLKPTGSILLHCDWRTSHRARVILDEVFGDDRVVNHLVWSYGLGGSGPRAFARKHDDILFYSRGPEYWFEPPRVPATSRRMAGESKKATDVLDIASINNMSHERTGWPTQKPLALLEMLVSACSPPGGVVLDPFCGSGTTLVAAVKLGRRAIGIDRSPAALRLTGERLAAITCGAATDPDSPGSSQPADA